MHSAAGDGDHCSITLQEGVLLDGAVKSILGVRGIVAQIECRWMVAQHSVSHGHFCRQGLQGIKALVGIVDGTLQLLILLLEGFLTVPTTVLIPSLPQHSRVKSAGSRN